MCTVKHSERKAKAINNLTLMDDKFFRFFFKDNPEALEDVISACLGEEGLKVERMNTQDDIVNLYGHSISMDARVITKDGRHIDVEVQKGHFDETKPRSQYYLAALMFNSLESGSHFTDLDDVYVIFIMDKDYFRHGEEKYESDDIVLQPHSIRLETKGHLIFINGEADSESAIGKLMNDFRCKDSENMQYNRLRERMKNIKRPEVIETMQSELDKIYEEEFEERLKEGIEEGVKKGIEERVKKGITEEIVKIAKKMISDGLSIELIAKYTGLSSGEIQAI